MFFGRFLITLNCVLYVAIALWALFLPQSVLQGLGLEATSRAAIIEMQVLVAGSFIGFCVLLCGGILDQRKTKRSLIGLFTINAAWLLTRCIGLLEGLSQDNSTYLYMGFELAMLILVLIALRQVNGPRGRTLFRQEEASF
ncbi:MAG: DUF4345 family protein [Litorivicinaceae bacterium]|jgi:hypothetical protein|nr:DUF4345 family protein [Litorivicinaceae bacterium]